MERTLELRENAARCLRLSKCVDSPEDIVYLETLAAKATRDAERIEAYLLAYRGPEQQPDAPLDRRRTGRRDDASPMLIPMLRDSLPYPPHDEPDHLSASRGIVTWAAISAVVWAAVIVLFRMSR